MFTSLSPCKQLIKAQSPFCVQAVCQLGLPGTAKHHRIPTLLKIRPTCLISIQIMQESAFLSTLYVTIDKGLPRSNKWKESHCQNKYTTRYSLQASHSWQITTAVMASLHLTVTGVSENVLIVMQDARTSMKADVRIGLLWASICGSNWPKHPCVWHHHYSLHCPVYSATICTQKPSDRCVSFKRSLHLLIIGNYTEKLIVL